MNKNKTLFRDSTLDVLLNNARRRENEGKAFVLLGVAVVTFSISSAYLLCYLAGTLP